MIKVSLLASMKLGRIQYFPGGLNKFLGPERGGLLERGTRKRIYGILSIYSINDLSLWLMSPQNQNTGKKREHGIHHALQHTSLVTKALFPLSRRASQSVVDCCNNSNLHHAATNGNRCNKTL